MTSELASGLNLVLPDFYEPIKRAKTQPEAIT